MDNHIDIQAVALLSENHIGLVLALARNPHTAADFRQVRSVLERALTPNPKEVIPVEEAWERNLALRHAQDRLLYLTNPRLAPNIVRVNVPTNYPPETKVLFVLAQLADELVDIKERHSKLRG